MKYVAVIDDSILCEHEKANSIFVGMDKNGRTIRIDLKPLKADVLTNRGGKSIYLHQKYIDCLMKFAEEEVMKDIINKIGE